MNTIDVLVIAVIATIGGVSVVRQLWRGWLERHEPAPEAGRLAPPPRAHALPGKWGPVGAMQHTRESLASLEPPRDPVPATVTDPRIKTWPMVVACPTCGAAPGTACKGGGLHVRRVEAGHDYVVPPGEPVRRRERAVVPPGGPPTPKPIEQPAPSKVAK